MISPSVTAFHIVRSLLFAVSIVCSQINDRYEFFDEIDLDREDRKYLSPTGRGRNEINKYK